MSANIGLDKAFGRDIESKIKEESGIAIPALEKLDTAIKSLEGNWEGESARKFLDAYNEISPTLTVKLPELMAELQDNLDKRLTALEQADSV